MFDAEVEADESYFGGHRKDRQGRGCCREGAVFGLSKRNGKVYTVAVPIYANGHLTAHYP